jgi:hypothetical protein
MKSILRPGQGELDVGLLEGDRAVAEVRVAGVSAAPLDLVVGVDALSGEMTTEADAGLLGSECHENLRMPLCDDLTTTSPCGWIGGFALSPQDVETNYIIVTTSVSTARERPHPRYP